MKNIFILIVIAALAIVLYKQLATQTSPTDTPNHHLGATAEDKSEPVSNLPISASLISPAAEGAEVFIISPKDGETVSSPLTVKFGISNMVVAKAGNNLEFSGHHHLLINLEQLPDMAAPLPATEQVIHFGGAQTEATIELSPGSHSLQLLLGNYLHIPHDKPIMSEKINIIVE